MSTETIGHGVIGIHTREDAEAYVDSMRKQDGIKPGGGNINSDPGGEEGERGVSDEKRVPSPQCKKTEE